MWLASLGAASSAQAAACTWNPVCPYQATAVLGGSDAASLQGPLDVALTPTGDVVVADRGGESVREFTSTGQLVQQIGTPGSYDTINGLAVDPSSGEIWVSDDMGVHGFTAAGTPEATAVGNGVGPMQMEGIAVGPNDTLYMFNGDTSTIYEYSSSGTILSMWPAAGVAAGDIPLPVTMAVDSQGDLYIAEIGSSVVKEFTSAGTAVATISLSSSVASMAISGSTLYAQFGSGPGAEIDTYDLSGDFTGGFVDNDLEDNAEGAGATFAVDGSVIVAATTDHTIQELGLDGTPTATWGGLANDDFQASDALADAAGDIYVIDSGNDRVIRYDAQGDPPTVFADLSADGTPGLASFDAQGDLVVDTYAGLVTLNPDGSVASVSSNCCTTPAGTPLADIPAETDYYATDSAGDVYIDAFRGSSAVPIGDIAKYSPSGRLLGTIDVSASWGPGIPGPIAVDAQGRIYTATNADDIREFDPSGAMIAVWSTSAPVNALSVAANGDVYASTGSTVTRYYDFLDPLPPVPPASDSPMGQSAQKLTAQVEAEVAAAAQSGTGAVRTTIACTGSPGAHCAGKLMLSANKTLLGSRTFSIPSGKRASVTVKLNRAGRRLLVKRTKLSALLTASYRVGPTSSLLTTTRKVVLRGRRAARRTRRR
jgi:hypothetical protein